MENALKRKGNLVACVLVLIVFCSGIVFADDVVVKEGDMEVRDLNASGDITVAGKVGIGTSSPSEELDVVGDMSITGEVVGDLSVTEGDITVDGRVGIGTTSPSRELDVFGDMSITGDVVGDLSVTGDATISGTGTFGKIETPTQYFEFQSTFSGPPATNTEMYFVGPRNKDMWFGFFADGQDYPWGNAFGIYLDNDTGAVAIEALYGNGVLTFGKFGSCHLEIKSNKKLMFNDEKLTINHDGTNARMDYGTDISYPLLLSGYVSAEDFIPRQTVYDKLKGSALDWIKDSSDYKGVDGQTKYSEFYGYTTYYVTDYNRPEVEFYDEIVRSKSGRITVQKSRTIYPHKKTEEGTSLDKEVAVLRQAVYELKQEVQILRDQLCSQDPGYSWCK